MTQNHDDHSAHMQECKRFLPDLSEYIDGELSPELCTELERHMSECERCRIVVNTTQKTIDLYHTCNDQEKTPIKVRERLYKRLNLEDYLIGEKNISKHE